jgi:dienelactone hydrolase
MKGGVGRSLEASEGDLTMRDGRVRTIRAWAVVAAVALGTLGAALAQDPKGDDKGEPKAKVGKKKGGLRAPAPPPKKLGRRDEFARANPGPGDVVPQWPYHFKFRLASRDGTKLGAFYYPAKPATGAPAVLLVHEKGRSGKDFEDPVEDLHNKGFAEHLQEEGYAVLIVDLRGHGVNPRRELSATDRQKLPQDLDAAYSFLIDRHNREELNLAKLGVLGVGEGADLVAAWAARPGAAVASEGRLSDLNAVVLVSPVAEGFGYRLANPIAQLAPRIPLMLVAAENDAASADPVKVAQPAVRRQRQNKVELFPTTLHGAKLLRFQPGVPAAIVRFLDQSLKSKRDEWEPRYNWEPAAYSDVEVARKPDAKKADAPKKAEAKKGEAKKEEAKKAPAKKDDADKDDAR